MNDYWLLRYPNGDAFALALLPYNYVYAGGRTAELEARPPQAFEHVIQDNRNDSTCIGYTYEVIPPTQWETLAEFGIPIVEEKTNDDNERWLEIQ